YPADVPLRMTIRLYSDESGTVRVYYFNGNANERQSVRADVRGGGWTMISLRLPPLGPQYRIRFNPPAHPGNCIVQSISFAEARPLAEPSWHAPEENPAVDTKLTIAAGEFRLSRNDHLNQGFTLSVGETRMAVGWTHSQIVYQIRDSVRWFSVDA